MLKELLPPYIQIVRNIEERGYDIIPDQLSNKKFIAILWLNEKFVKRGKKQYKTWQEAQRQTYIDLFKFFKSK
ncbi:MAG: hypothetical protein ACWA5P_02085 [bacterium]